MKKCIDHIYAVSIDLNEPMDTKFYELGERSECVVCRKIAEDWDRIRRQRMVEFIDALTEFVLSDAGEERKKSVIDKFRSS